MADAKQKQEVIGVVERVARAICEEEWGARSSWLLVSEYSRSKALRHARAAIEAMREPTDAMLDIGADSVDAEMCWKGMIDAALNEQVSE